MHLFLLVDPKQQQALTKSLNSITINQPYSITLFEPHSLPMWPAMSRVVLYLSDAQIRELLVTAGASRWQIAVLPHPESPLACRAFGISSHWQQAMDDSSQEQAAEIDLLLCNELPLLRSVIVGDTFGFRPGGAITQVRERLRRFWLALKKLRQLTPSPYQITTQNEEHISTAAIGMSIVEHGNNSVIGHQLLPNSAMNDGRCHCIILAPRSIMEMLKLVAQSLFARHSHARPRCVGLIATSALTIRNGQELHYQHDELELCAEQLTIECIHKGLILLPGSLISLSPAKVERKESRKLQNIPTGSTAGEIAHKPLDWLAHAAADEFKELYQTLREQAKTSAVFINLMVLSTGLATLGLFANSSPVIIGAMLLAPLMGPIIAMAMAIVRQDELLLKGSFKTLVVGLALSLGCASLLATLIPMTQITSEIAARTQPNLLDLGVAVLSGIVGGYAHSRTSLSKGLVGVAIAVALVPPLAVTGIGIGWLNSELIVGSLLLFLTNLAGNFARRLFELFSLRLCSIQASTTRFDLLLHCRCPREYSTGG